MGVDGIGKGAPVAPPDIGSVDGSSSPAGAAPALTQTARATEATGSEALAQLERGEITRDRYLDLRVEGATAHLEGRLSSAELDQVRATLRAELESDPVLVEWVRRATAGAAGEAT